MDPLMFNEGELRVALEVEIEKVREAIESVPEEHVLQADIDEWASALAEEFRVICPELRTNEIYREPVEDVKVDVSWDQSRYFSDETHDRRIAGYRLVVRIPFEGEGAVFDLRPNQFTFNPPRGRVLADELALTMEYPHDTKPDIDAKVNDFLNTVQKWLGWARAQIDSHNGTLEQFARSAIVARRSRIEERDEHLASSKIPVGKPSKAGKTYIAEAVVRRPAPKLPKTKTDEPGVQLEPVLADKVFEHILSVLRMQGLQMEQAPKTYAQMDEEARRDLYLATLNTHYEGRGEAEAFNVNGKTDLLIRFEGRSLFIGECKFWEGAKAFSTAIDQLFGYASWRDTKLALVFFVREKGLTEIVEKAQAALEEHPQFVAWQTAASETELRATVAWPGDDRRHADLNVLFVHTPNHSS